MAVTTLIALTVLGGQGASADGAGVLKGEVRVTFWGALAMAATAAVGMVSASPREAAGGFANGTQSSAATVKAATSDQASLMD
jgi:hypothetical protein